MLLDTVTVMVKKTQKYAKSVRVPFG